MLKRRQCWAKSPLINLLNSTANSAGENYEQNSKKLDMPIRCGLRAWLNARNVSEWPVCIRRQEPNLSSRIFQSRFWKPGHKAGQA